MAAFTYMGTKKSLAATIGALCEGLESGPFFDLFAGISAAGAAVAPRRQIWCNDVQIFSRTLTEALYLSVDDQPRVEVVAREIERLGNENLNALMGQAKAQVEKELWLLWDGTAQDQIAFQELLINSAIEWKENWKSLFSHCLFSTRYAGTYLGLIQSMQIDSIRYGADVALDMKLISREEHRWAMLALCRSIAATSNSTGHFAQYLTPKASNLGRVMGKRRRCAWSYWFGAFKEMRPVGEKRWRSLNRVFHGEAVEILHRLDNSEERPGIVYADPPYTSDQYSRYYHLLETALLYDYPATEGKGLYREGRFRSSFSLAREVEGSFSRMISAAAKVSPSLMISYPSNGLLPDSLQRIPKMMQVGFARVFEPLVIPHKHSTLGASKGREKEDVEECIFVATNSLH